jgi:hypothetical protein
VVFAVEPKVDLNLTLQEESRRSAHGEQAGTKYSGYFSKHRSQGQNPNHDLSGQRRQAHRKDSVLRQVFRAVGKQQPGTIDLQARHLNRGQQSERDAF